MSIFFYGFPEPAIWYGSKEIPCLFVLWPIPGFVGREIFIMNKRIYEKPTSEVVMLCFETNMLATTPSPGGNEGIGGGVDD